MNLHRIVVWLIEPPPAGLGIEFRAGDVLLVRFGERRGRPEMDLCLKAPIPSDAVQPSMLEPNIKEPEALAGFLRELFDQAGVRGRRISLTLPDTLARVALVDLPEAPRSRGDAAELVRFRLKKSLPFSSTEARVAFDLVSAKPPTCLAGVMHESVVSQYEQLLEGLGFHVGAVGISTLSLLNLWRPVVDKEVPFGADYFFLNAEQDYFSVALVRNRIPVLVRTLGQRSPQEGEEAVVYGPEDLLREIVPTVIFYREKLGGSSPARVYYRCLRSDLTELPGLLEGQFEAPVESFDLHRAVAVGEHLHIDGPLASMASAAAGAALGKAA